MSEGPIPPPPLPQQEPWGPPPPGAIPAPKPPGPKARRPWLWPLAAGLGGLVLGGMTGSSTGQQDAETALSEKRAAERRADDAEARVTAAEQSVKALASREAAVKAAEAAVRRGEAAVGRVEAAAKANSFGEGVHVVGVDIQPGTYRTDNAQQCYWAKLTQNDDIIDNDIVSGRTTVTIASSVYKFQSRAGCGTWQKVG